MVLNYSHQNAIDITENQEVGITKGRSHSNYRDIYKWTQNLTPWKPQRVKLDELKKDLNVLTQEENEDITVKKVVKTAISQFCTEFVR